MGYIVLLLLRKYDRKSLYSKCSQTAKKVQTTHHRRLFKKKKAYKEVDLRDKQPQINTTKQLKGSQNNINGRQPCLSWMN